MALTIDQLVTEIEALSLKDAAALASQADPSAGR